MISQQNGDGTISFIFVHKSTPVRAPLAPENDSTGIAWARLVEDAKPRQLERKLAAAGWTFVYKAGIIKHTGGM
jgi:hypothetical protein